MSEDKSITLESAEAVFTPEELRQWRARSARVPTRERARSAELFRQTRVLAAEFHRLREQGVDPGSSRAQALLERHNQLVLVHGSRERFLSHIDWNPTIARKVFAWGNRVLERDAGTGRPADGKLIEYMVAVRSASRWWRSLERILELAKGLHARRALLGSAVAEELAKRFKRVCRTHGLGDAGVFARWQREFGLSKRGKRLAHHDAATRAAWQYLAEAVGQLSAQRD